jgi:hypothetical protein
MVSTTNDLRLNLDRSSKNPQKPGKNLARKCDCESEFCDSNLDFSDPEEYENIIFLS